MSHWRSRFEASDKHLGSVNLWDEKSKSYIKTVVTIKEFVDDKLVGSMGEEKKTFARFNELPKMMVMNKENFKRLMKIFESVEENDYLGKQVVLGVEKVKSPEGMVDALRFSVRDTLNLSKAPAAKPAVAKKPFNQADLEKAMNLIGKGAVTVEKLQESYDINPEQLKQLQDVQG
jgi:uncharacterized protein YqiB (DUF1249 family)